MKKFFAIVLALALLLSMGACGSFVSIMPGTELPESLSDDGEETEQEQEEAFSEQPFFAFMGWSDFGANYYSDTPVALSCQTEAGEGGIRGCRAYVFDRASIVAACDALRGVTVTGRAEQSASGGAEYILTMSDGTEYAASFAPSSDGTGYILSAPSGDYTVSGGDGLWDIAFPSYSDEFDIFDLYFDDSVRAFADNFYEDMPVSVGYRMNSGATITSEDEDVVKSVFQTLAGATVTVVENQPDQNIDVTDVKDFVFTMEDGTTYAFTFAQQCLAVTANPAFGTVYYWLNGISSLWDISFAPQNETAFEGGTVADLRDDMQQTAEIANGERDDLSVIGVFVDYDIGDQTGYFALSDDAATDFLRTLTGIAVSGDTADAPDGDRVTVSVTLSDSTGPIFYFIGDAIQQMVGVNYVCDSGQMSELRSAVLELAADESNAVEVEEGTTE